MQIVLREMITDTIQEIFEAQLDLGSDYEKGDILNKKIDSHRNRYSENIYFKFFIEKCTFYKDLKV